MRFWHFAIVTVLLSTSCCYAEILDSYTVVKLSYGTNQVDFNNDGKEDLVVLARRENFNAHGFDVVSFYSEQPQDGNKAKVLGIIPIFDKNNEKLTFNVSGGADCILNDFRLLKPKLGIQSLLIIANRKISESFYEKNTVTFSYYNLEKNSSDEVGFPFSYFKFSKVDQAKAKYCDVNEAFSAELGLGIYKERE
jgi:hypothetical protein